MVQIDAISKPEAIKQQSRQLRGHIARDLADTATPFDKEGYALLKFHGVYQGYDRDSATERKQRGDDKIWQFMVRARIPGGRLTADQYLALDAIAERYAIQRRLEADARRLSTHLLPQTRAYHEIWVEGAPWREDESAAQEPDPLYGERYLPRKFKMGLAIPEDNTIDVLTNDLAVVALFEADRLLGYNFLLGGGHGMTHNNPKTYPRLATPVAFIEPDDLLEAAAAVVRLHRDHGDRGNRRHARLKYVIAENGEDWARERLEEHLGKTLEPCRGMPAFAVPDHLGWHEQGDGKLYLGVPVPSGRISDGPQSLIRTALREIVERFGCDPILMPSQDIILSQIRREDRDAIEGLLREHGVRLADEMVPAERWALACPALPTCGLALTEAERVRDDIVAAIEARLRHYGLEREPLSIRIAGCPNGCSRPYTGDIGIVGRMPGFYSVYVGGDFAGTRLNTPLADKVALREIAEVLDPLFALYASTRLDGEGFGDFCHRAGLAALQQAVAETRKGAA